MEGGRLTPFVWGNVWEFHSFPHFHWLVQPKADLRTLGSFCGGECGRGRGRSRGGGHKSEAEIRKM